MKAAGACLVVRMARRIRMSTLAAAGLLLVPAILLCATRAAAQNEKRTVYTEKEFRWQGHLQAGQTLEVINRNGEIEANGGEGGGAVSGSKRDGDEKEMFVEVVEYSDGATICAVYAEQATPGRCHRGGVSSESSNWHGHHAKINFSVSVPNGVKFKAMTTNGGVHCRDLKSVVEATTTNGLVEISTSEWASARTTNGGVRVAMGKAGWSGELELMTTNGGVEVIMPASAEFRVRATTTNGSVRSDFPVTVQGGFSSKDLTGTVGGGGRDLRVATTNGGIELHKGA